MKTLRIAVLTGFLVAAAPGFAQHAHHAPAATQDTHAHSPYSGMQQRAIKALSDQQIADLRAGKGMAMAMPAELNGYPGPSHVLQLAAPLDLSEVQRQRTRALFEQMQAESSALGEKLIAAEQALDALFSERKADTDTVEAATAAAARVQGALRATHLKYHVLMMEILDARQVAKYAELRGYR